MLAEKAGARAKVKGKSPETKTRRKIPGKRMIQRRN
jgi:hypothetical protein